MSDMHVCRLRSDPPTWTPTAFPVLAMSDGWLWIYKTDSGWNGREVESPRTQWFRVGMGPDVRALLSMLLPDAHDEEDTRNG